jgi:hypothetical protein
LKDPYPHWRWLEIVLYGQEYRIQLITGIALWHTPGKDPVPLCGVLVRCPQDSFEPVAFCCSNTTSTPRQIILWAS